jgi:hypothetical protein
LKESWVSLILFKFASIFVYSFRLKHSTRHLPARQISDYEVSNSVRYCRPFGAGFDFNGIQVVNDI